jgi:hypothetical protein
MKDKAAKTPAPAPGTPDKAERTLLKMLKLNTRVFDKVTGQHGHLDFMIFALGGNVEYHFQPREIDKETLHPVKGFWVVPERLDGAEFVDLPEGSVDPRDFLGNVVTDVHSGIKGVAIRTAFLMSGCQHVCFQPEGRIPKTGQVPDRMEINILQVAGDGIPVWNPELVEEIKKKSPGGFNTPYHERN